MITQHTIKSIDIISKSYFLFNFNDLSKQACQSSAVTVTFSVPLNEIQQTQEVLVFSTHTPYSAAMDLKEQFIQTRQQTLEICAPLTIEDMVVQPASFVSPPKWHLAHTTWCFEYFLLNQIEGYNPYCPDFFTLFNSYYKSAGKFWPQSQRGDLSRPTVNEVSKYREHVDKLITEHFDSLDQKVIELGIHHEQQHQELLVMDIKYILAQNPSLPTINLPSELHINGYSKTSPKKTFTIDEQLIKIGTSRHEFKFDNETPEHKHHLHSYQIENHLISNSEYLEFIKADGYIKPEYWLSEGWKWIKDNQIQAPLYWTNKNSEWLAYEITDGLRPLSEIETQPVQHISYFEAYAFAKWRNKRLPTEAEYEFFAHQHMNSEQEALWQWTSSSYQAYPGFESFQEGFAEYNAKFMCGQQVLRGGCWSTPPSHYRATYRNFYYPQQRWMFSGLRLAK